jgi:hypothetical protein
MAQSEHVFRIHPAIGIARVGNSEEYCISPETMAGMPVEGVSDVTGGLPIRPGTESEMVTSRELRDRDGALKRQAARFKIYRYSREEAARYPSGAGTEVTIGGVVDGRTVADIVWTVHLANKKAANYITNDDLGLAVYEKAHASELQLRNLSVGSDPDNAARLRKLIIDPGPRAIRGTDTRTVRFDLSNRTVRVSVPRTPGSARSPPTPNPFPTTASRGCTRRWERSIRWAICGPTSAAACSCSAGMARRAAGCCRTVRPIRCSTAGWRPAWSPT